MGKWVTWIHWGLININHNKIKHNKTQPMGHIICAKSSRILRFFHQHLQVPFEEPLEVCNVRVLGFNHQYNYFTTDCMTTSSNWTFSTLLVICAGNSPVTGEFHAQRPVTRSFDVFFDLRLNKRLRKQWREWWFDTPSRSLWRHCNGPSSHHRDNTVSSGLSLQRVGNDEGVSPCSIYKESNNKL